MPGNVIVTGANSGIGYETSKHFAGLGATVTMAVRDTARGDDAATRIRAAVPNARVETMRLDLSDLTSVRAFAAEYLDRHQGPDTLINNAGIMAVPRRLSVDGYELHFATNHLGHFALTGLLIGAMRARESPRVVTVASIMHRLGRIPFDNLRAEGRYSKWLSYSNSKLANILFALELQRRCEAASWNVLSVAAHPGYASTELQLAGPRMTGNSAKYHGYAVLNKVVGRGSAAGAQPTVYAATATLPSGAYVGPSGFFEVKGSPAIVRARRKAYDPVLAERLWRLSERITGVTYPFHEER
jgi:NAD(P)-dependent dehydrogenase (short-subunit alcohol dehydrogenase family)